MDASPTRRGFLKTLGTGALTAAAWLGFGGAVATRGEDSCAPFLRPPGAIDEDEFLATCIRCGRCADACPNRAIVAFTEESGREHSAKPSSGQRNTPVIFPRRQGCILCNGAQGDMLLCTVACPSGALTPVRKEAASIQAGVDMGTAEVDRNLCYSYNGNSCGACVRACPFEGQALRAGLWEKPLIDPDLCVGCGLCERACLTYPQSIRIRPPQRKL